MSYLPENYPDSRETAAFQAALQPEVELMWRARDELLAQLNPRTASDWGLRYWEDALGLGACDGVDLDTRRRQIVAKLQGRAATTPQVVKDVAETMLGAPVKVIEVFDEYRVELEVDSGGLLPAGVPQLRERLREIMPAHLDWGLVIPLWRPIPIRAAPGPRMSRAAPPPYRPRFGPGRIPAACALGTRYSTVTPPMAAYPSTSKEVKAYGL